VKKKDRVQYPTVRVHFEFGVFSSIFYNDNPCKFDVIYFCSLEEALLKLLDSFFDIRGREVEIVSLRIRREREFEINLHCVFRCSFRGSFTRLLRWELWCRWVH